MIEILFRGKRLDNGEWIEGHYHCTDYLWHGKEIRKHYILPQNHGDAYVVNPGTVGQFTCMTDRNGTKIFCGDVIRSDNGKQSAVSVVNFGEYLPKMFYKMLDVCAPGKRHLLARGFYAVSVDKKEELILFQSPCVTVIGNIHDNPELLGGEQ